MMIEIDPIRPLRLPTKIREKVKRRQAKVRAKNKGTAASVSGSIK
jgi:hypothetical protein